MIDVFAVRANASGKNHFRGLIVNTNVVPQALLRCVNRLARSRRIIGSHKV